MCSAAAASIERNKNITKNKIKCIENIRDSIYTALLHAVAALRVFLVDSQVAAAGLRSVIPPSSLVYSSFPFFNRSLYLDSISIHSSSIYFFCWINSALCVQYISVQLLYSGTFYTSIWSVLSRWCCCPTSPLSPTIYGCDHRSRKNWVLRRDVWGFVSFFR